MNCLEFRRQLDTDPECRDDEFVRHKAECQDCAAAIARVSRFQNALKDAVRIDVRENLTSKILLKQTFSPPDSRVGRRASLALAAGIVGALGLGVAGSLFFTRQSELAREVLALVRAAPYALVPKIPLEPEPVAKALRPVGLELTSKITGVTFASQCTLQNTLAAHLVFQGSIAPITVFVMPKVDVASRESIRGDALRGELLPHSVGAIAVVGVPDENLDHAVKKVRTAIGPRRA